MSSGEGFLVVLSDVKSEDDRDYLAWLTTEHVQERLGIPGFLAVRIFRMPIALGHRYFIWYRLKSADVVDSPAYLERLNNPTPWSQRIMPILGNFGRGGGTVAVSIEDSAANFILVVDLNAVPSDPLQMVSSLKSLRQIKAAHLLVTDLQKSEIRTNERKLRTSHSTFASLVLVESDSAGVLGQAESTILAMKESPHTNAINGVYKQVFST